MSSPLPAILFEPDGYDVRQPRLMGRQVAGASFLRAAVQDRQDSLLSGCSPHKASGEAFIQLVQAVDPAAEAAWLPAHRLDLLSRNGLLYRPDPGIGLSARTRLREGPARYALSGVTHTTATHGAMSHITDLLHAPVMPWDALICTSQAVATTVRAVLDAGAEEVRWRFGPQARITEPMLPVIPLGVHCRDFESAEDQRAQARKALGIAADEIVILFVGRLVFAGKAHPFQMYRAAQACAERTGARITLLQCGWAPNAAIDEVFRDGAAQFCPDVKALFVDGRDLEARARCWASGDIFLSLSDGVQETFGLTPIEAMAAGLPTVVSDWNGYKDTVVDGIDGFRIPSWSPGAAAGDRTARLQETGAWSYDRACWAEAVVTSVDQGVLNDRVEQLVTNPDLRRRMGAAGRKRARDVFDWSVVFKAYRALWAEQTARRLKVAEHPDEIAWIQAAPTAAAERLATDQVFGHYPTHRLHPATRVSLADTALGSPGLAALNHRLFIECEVTPEQAGRVLASLAEADLSVTEIGQLLRQDTAQALRTLGVMAKAALVRLYED